MPAFGDSHTAWAPGVEKPSNLGSWSYEPADAKLAQETKGGTPVQMRLANAYCRYGELAERLPFT
jgi:uncharacterized protein